MAQQRSQTRRGSSKRDRGGSNTKTSRSAGRPSEGKVDPQLHGRQPGHEPDVFIDIRKVNVDEVYVDVEELEAHLANLLQVVAGVHVHLRTVWRDTAPGHHRARLSILAGALLEPGSGNGDTANFDPQLGVSSILPPHGRPATCRAS